MASIGGFLYGYDTAVIAGGEQQIQSGWSLMPFVHGLVMSSALWGTVIGAVSGGHAAGLTPEKNAEKCRRVTVKVRVD